VPRVGHSVAARGLVAGAYDIVSRPTEAKTVPYADAGILSILTIKSERTSFGLASSQVFTKRANYMSIVTQ
jgi:hypothetical protein